MDRRNDFVFEKRHTCPKKLLILAKDQGLEEFQQANKEQKTEGMHAGNAVDKSRWVKPYAEFVKVNGMPL